jgi:hypothetical protein
MRLRFVLISVLFLTIPVVSAGDGLSPDDLIKLKKAGISEETIQLLLRLEIERMRALQKGSAATIGTRIVREPDGTKRVMTYAVEDPHRCQKERIEQRSAGQSNRGTLNNLIIDTRRTPRGR